jgi:hypothetical protein
MAILEKSGKSTGKSTKFHQVESDQKENHQKALMNSHAPQQKSGNRGSFNRKLPQFPLKCTSKCLPFFTLNDIGKSDRKN